MVNDRSIQWWPHGEDLYVDIFVEKETTSSISTDSVKGTPYSFTVFPNPFKTAS